MATTTTNYGFDVPTSSDLVKNGATQIALLGQDLDTFLFRPFSRNAILNSSMNIWQRGTSIAVSGFAAYTADRWYFSSGSNSGRTVSRQLTNDTTNLPFIQYCSRVQRDNGNTGATAIIYSQSLETVNSIPFVGKSVTLSFYARAGANFSSASSALGFQLQYGTGTDQNIQGTYTGATNIISSSATLTTTWQRFTATATVPTAANELGIQFFYTAVGTAGAADFFEITGVQLEVGNQASPYASFSGTIQGELAACQRYYYRRAATAVTTYAEWCLGMNTSTTIFRGLLKLPITMRIAPTTVEYSGNIRVTDNATYSATVSSVSVEAGESSEDNVRVNAVTTGLTANQPAFLGSTSTSTYLGFSAEL
jgi:hypothetical protein